MSVPTHSTSGFDCKQVVCQACFTSISYLRDYRIKNYVNMKLSAVVALLAVSSVSAFAPSNVEVGFGMYLPLLVASVTMKSHDIFVAVCKV